ncbi:ABC transporter permease subunit [Roseofilum reptotaenium CS-1145]|uniref:Amino acid ABC transporter permease n=1 Tax=Roseofilum reptotaenium AO1-A TaxID=1925591 RepID=A0A1L9QME0_9CYAN|nr:MULTISPECIES: ABC transporter permease subunit [Roseofilum]MBP0027010.1 ABC transporter permease subunit [Roseofilum sp. Guam]MDB9516753.1 ABC transporter permease subunit [Roseofilum reptotaenium CS-1145]OJJ21966.1 amino acid ABC transporter permease [Roseofilum reptotaenium AO1-A]
MTSANEHTIPLWRDDRFWRVALQVLAIAIVISVISLLTYNVSNNLQRAGIEFGFDFLDTQASFAIGESIIPYDPARDSYGRVLLAGLVNTLRIIISGIILTTLVGIAVGVASFSNNWLLRKGSEVYVELIRNVPLLLQLFFWYRAVFSKLPRPTDRIEVMGLAFLSNRGVFLPWPKMGWSLAIWCSVLIGLAIAAVVLWKIRIKSMVERGSSGKPQLTALWIIGMVALLIITVAFGWEKPTEIELGQITGGLRLTGEFAALLTGLVLYTAAFIAEIVRAGIQAVAKGQWEAARALGLQSGLMMRLVVFPQALRVIIPPLSSQYMNLAKNSSLGAAIAYAEIYNVANTTYNQSGRPVEVMLIIMVTYLLMNLIISLGMNQINRVVQLQER